MTRGELRIYLGAVPGVGKTYAMLDEAHRRAGRGADVVVAAIATRDRPATEAMLVGLDVIGTELDAAAVLARKPAVAVVDEVAHVDHLRGVDVARYEAIPRLLDAGITVLTTIDIGQIESLADMVRTISGIAPGPLVPDRVVKGADQIHLVDQTPEATVRRLAHGNIFSAGELDPERAEVYRPGPLAALRGLTLTWMAERAKEASNPAGSDERWHTDDVVLVACTAAATTPEVIRRAARLADRQRTRLLGLYIRESDDDGRAPPATGADEVRRLLGQLGGEFREVPATDVATALIDAVAAEQATQLVIGATTPSMWDRLRGRSLVHQLVDRSPVDVHIVRPDDEVREDPAGVDLRRVAVGRPLRPLSPRRSATGWAMAVVVPGAVALGLTEVHPSVGLSTQLLVMLLGVTVTAMVGGIWPATVSAVIGFALANWYFIPPLRELSISSTEDAVSLVAFLFIALTVGWFVSLSARRAAESLRSQSHAATLAAMAGVVAGSVDPLPTLVERLQVIFGADGAALQLDQGSGAVTLAASGDTTIFDADGAALDLPVGRSGRLLLGGAGVRGLDAPTTAAFLGQLQVGVEQRLLHEQRRQAASVATENELRAALLAAVSHDLRTPLATLKAAISSLRQRGEWPQAVRNELLETIDTNTDRLTALVANLLDMTRLQSGAVELHMAAVYLDEVVHRALGGLPAHSSAITIDLDERLPPVAADGALLEHVVANLMDNAAKWSPPDRPPRVDAAIVGTDVHLRVIDHGPGIPASARDMVRRPFQRRDDGTKTPGTGLGLSVADGFATLMGAALRLGDTPGGGTTATVVMPIDDRRGANHA